MTNLDKIDAMFHEMCRASKIAHAPAQQLVEMRRAFYSGVLCAISRDLDLDTLIDDLKAFSAMVGTEEEIRRSAP